MEAVLAFWNAYGGLVLAVLGAVVGLWVWVARGEGQELARLTTELVLRLSSQGWDVVTEAQVKDIAGRVYDGARDYAGPAWLRAIPWRLFVTREMVQNWAWTAWMAAHKWFDSALAGKAVETAQAAKVVPRGVAL